MKPDASYGELQNERQILIEQHIKTERRDKLYRELEARFMAAWQFGPDRRRLACRLKENVRIRPDRNISGFDHCTFYTGANDRRIVVTQPYGNDEAALKAGLALDEKMSPEIIVATDWAFYFPGHADLIIIKFPFGYAEAFTKLKE